MGGQGRLVVKRCCEYEVEGVPCCSVVSSEVGVAVK